jgi:hypothetical protein
VGAEFDADFDAWTEEMEDRSDDDGAEMRTCGDADMEDQLRKTATPQDRSDDDGAEFSADFNSAANSASNTDCGDAEMRSCGDDGKCPVCGGPLGATTGKCGKCILDRIAAEQQQDDGESA